MLVILSEARRRAERITYIHKINERITNTNRVRTSAEGTRAKGELYSLAVIGKINAQVHEVVLAPARLVNEALEHGLVDLVGDVPQHDLHR